ncbi:transcriptional regulator, AbrB family [Candidatus Vecturithrix granuli]|uniref:Transcriptional regulator, AbrB family n=1 Tax=Vecturithrix granuli TaxID=1499967 RepID=A0A081C1E1_VECG1|nr:transcriptional regulator, AbrB family [Candidatus Vecturithrix granuli]
MQVTADGHMKIPRHVRERLGIAPCTEVEFVEENGRFYLIKIAIRPRTQNKFQRFRGVATVKMRTDEIMQLTRGEA